MTVGYVPEGPRLSVVGVIVDGVRFEDWTDYSISSDLFTPANRFSMRCGPIPEKLKEIMLPGHQVSVYFGDGSEDGDVIVITGWIEGYVDRVTKESESADITGRDLASDLLENTVPQGTAIKDRALYDIAEDLCGTHGIPVLCTNEANRIAVADRKKYKKLMTKYNGSMVDYNAAAVPLQKQLAGTLECTLTSDKQFQEILAVNGFAAPLRPPFVPGIFKNLDEANPQDAESVWDFLARYAGRMEVHMWMAAAGMLVMQRPRYDQDPMYVFIENDRDPTLNNVIERTYGLAIAGMATSRTATGRVKPKDGGKKVSVESTVKSTKLIPSDVPVVVPATALRVASTLSREKWVLDPQARNQSKLTERNYYAMKAAETGFLQLSLTVSGHDQGGRLYTPDTVCRFVSDRLGIDGLFYIAACEYSLDTKSEEMVGQTTMLTLTPLDAWVPEAS